MRTPVEIQDLVAEVVHHYPAAQVELDPLPSGVCFLWVSLEGRVFVLEHDPKRDTGVSENLPTTPPFVGHGQAFERLTDAVTHFQSLLTAAGPTTLVMNRG